MSDTDPSPQADAPLHTSVILVVKGAGNQKPDETLDLFLNGFWPAVKSLDRDATIRQLHDHDIFPSGYRSSPHEPEPHNHITEICSQGHRLWIKESFWEPDLVPENSFSVLDQE